MKFYIFIFIALSVSRNVRVLADGLPNDELFDKSDALVTKLEKINTKSISELLEVLREAKQSCIDLEETYFNKGHNMIKEMIQKLIAYFKDENNNVPESKKEMLDKLVSVRQIEFSKCIGQAVNKAITLLNKEMQTIKLISKNIQVSRSLPMECLDDEDSHTCLLSLYKKLEDLLANTVEEVSGITKTTTASLDNLSKNLSGCTSKIVASFLNETPEIIAAVEAASNYCYTD